MAEQAQNQAAGTEREELADELRERVRHQPLLQAFIRAVEKADPKAAAQLREVNESGTPDERMGTLLDALDAEYAALRTQPQAGSVEQVESNDWTVPNAYVGVAYQEEEATDEDGGPIWTVPIECNGGWAQVADVCGGTKQEALARAYAICRALQGGEIPGEVVNHIERLFRSDREDDWIAAEALQHLASLQPDIASLLAGERRKAMEEAAEALPCTAEDPNEDDYQRGRFDGIMEYQRAIRSLGSTGGV